MGMANKPVIKNNNCLILKNNIEYIWARFIQANNMTTKWLTIIFYINPNLVLMWRHLSYKNIDRIMAWLIKLVYDKVIWWTRILSIHSVTTDVAPKKYLIYYLGIILAIWFLISHWSFALYLAYVLV